MISHIFGEITQSGEGYVVIDVAGIGYYVNVPKSISQELAGKNEKVKFHTYLHVREDALILYGFLEQSQLEMFKLLISVTRVGPAIAMNILSQIKIEELAAAIIHEDEKVLTRISGVGAKNAKRLILELKDKMKKKMEGVSLPGSSVNYDAVSALVSLGFPRQDAQRAVEAVSVSGG
jgi:Holliday junction DNA helicase RuvA